VTVQREEDLAVGESRREPVRGVDRQRRLADTGHPAKRVNPQDRVAAVRRCRQQLAQFGLPAGEGGDVARQRAGGRRYPARRYPAHGHRVGGNPAAGGGLERGLDRAGEAQRPGQQLGGVPAGRRVDSPLEVTDRSGAQPGRLGPFLLRQAGLGAQPPEQLTKRLRHVSPTDSQPSRSA
jgi:hypothetical protein